MKMSVPLSPWQRRSEFPVTASKTYLAHAYYEEGR